MALTQKQAAEWIGSARVAAALGQEKVFVWSKGKTIKFEDHRPTDGEWTLEAEVWPGGRAIYWGGTLTGGEER